AAPYVSPNLDVMSAHSSMDAVLGDPRSTLKREPGGGWQAEPEWRVRRGIPNEEDTDRDPVARDRECPPAGAWTVRPTRCERASGAWELSPARRKAYEGNGDLRCRRLDRWLRKHALLIRRQAASKSLASAGVLFLDLLVA